MSPTVAPSPIPKGEVNIVDFFTLPLLIFSFSSAGVAGAGIAGKGGNGGGFV